MAINYQPSLASLGGESIPREHPTVFANAQLLPSKDAATSWMVDRIKNAKQSVAVGSYIFRPNGYGEEVLDALIERTRGNNAIKGYLMLDREGSRQFKGTSAYKKLEAAQNENLQILRYGKRWNPLRGPIYHPKVFVADGGVSGAALGSMGFDQKKWGEEMVALTGRAAAEVNAEFIASWVSAGGKLDALQLDNLRRADTLNWSEDKVGTRLVANRPGVSTEATRAMLRGIANAKERIWIQTPFLSDERTVNALQRALERNPKLDVRIMMPGHDGAIVPGIRMLNQTFYSQLINSGAKVYEASKPMHKKAAIIDDTTQRGSMNITIRSMGADEELNLVSNEPQLMRQAEVQWNLEQSSSRLLNTADLNRFSQRILDGPLGKVVRKALSLVA